MLRPSEGAVANSAPYCVLIDTTTKGAVAKSRFEPISRIFRPLYTAVFQMSEAEISYLQQHPCCSHAAAHQLPSHQPRDHLSAGQRRGHWNHCCVGVIGSQAALPSKCPRGSNGAEIRRMTTCPGAGHLGELAVLPLLVRRRAVAGDLEESND